MALPVTLSNVVVGLQNSYHGPFKSPTGGSFYTILFDSTNKGLAVALKATDPTSSFTEQDSGNRPNLGTTAAQPGWTFQDGDNLHVIGQETAGGTSRRPWYGRFLTDDGSGDADTWIAIDGGTDRDILIDDTPNGTAQACTIAVRSDGDIVVAYQGATDMCMGSDFERIDWNVSTDGGVNWAGPVSLDNGGEIDWTGCVMVPGSSDRMHVFFKHDTNNDGFQRTIRSDDSLESFPSAFDSTMGGGIDYPFGPGIGGSTVSIPYKDGNTNSDVSIATFTSADTPSVSTETSVSDEVVRPIAEAVCGLAADGTDRHLLYIGGGVAGGDADLYHDKNTGSGWGTDIEELDGITGEHISPNVYDRSGQKLAFIYDDGGTVKYNEIVLAGVAPSGAGALIFGPIAINGTGVAGADGVGALALAVPTIAGTGVAGADGVGALTIAKPSIAGTGVEKFTATGALALAVPAIVGTGVGGAEGAGALLIPVPSISGTGAARFEGAGALLLGVPAIIGTGAEVFTAIGALLINPIAIVGTGVAGADGVGALALGPPLIAGTAVEEFIASGALALAVPTIAGTGLFGDDAEGTGALALATIAISGTGVGGAEGTGALLLTVPAIAGTGIEVFPATGALLLRVPTIAGTGVEISTAVGALALNTVAIAGIGVAGADGIGALLIAKPLINGTGIEEFIAAGALTIPGLSIAGAGIEEFIASGALLLGVPNISGTGVAGAEGIGNLTIAVVVISGAGVSSVVVLGAPRHEGLLRNIGRFMK